MDNEKSIIPLGSVEKLILALRGYRVILDVDLARLYGVTTKRLNEQIKRNRERFPERFMFKLTPAEKAEVVANCDHLRNLKYASALPHAFTEHGAIMAATVLNSPQAIQVSILIVEAFIRLREILATNKELAKMLGELDRRIATHDVHIRALFEAVRRLLRPPEKSKTPIGFKVKEKSASYKVKKSRRP